MSTLAHGRKGTWALTHFIGADGLTAGGYHLPNMNVLWLSDTWFSGRRVRARVRVNFMGLVRGPMLEGTTASRCRDDPAYHQMRRLTAEQADALVMVATMLSSAGAGRREQWSRLALAFYETLGPDTQLRVGQDTCPEKET